MIDLEAKNVRVCTLRAFEGALYSLVVGGYAWNREETRLLGTKQRLAFSGESLRRGMHNRKRKGRPQ